VIRSDAAIERRRTERLQALVVRGTALGPREFEAAFDALEAEMPFNCEHVVPQPGFAKHDPMRGDLHHLVACEPHCKSFRGSTPYADFADDRPRRCRATAATARPTASSRSPARGRSRARRCSSCLRHPGLIGDEARELQRERLPVLLAWHAAHPVDDYARHRNAAIAEVQGDRNPLIDHPEWALRIEFAAGFG
jgi:endonuclease I